MAHLMSHDSGGKKIPWKGIHSVFHSTSFKCHCVASSVTVTALKELMIH